MFEFKKFRKKLNSLGFKIKNGDSSGFRVIKKEINFGTNEVEIEPGGIYIRGEGDTKHKGYMFLKDYFIDRYGNYPKFHLVKCQTIREFIQRGNFNQRYEFSNLNVNDVIDKATGKVHCHIPCYNIENILPPETVNYYKELLKKGRLTDAIISSNS